MNAHSVTHPTDQTLSSYGLGKLDDGSADAVNKHLEQCPDCRKRVAEMSSDSFLGRVRDAQQPAGKAAAGRSQPGGSSRSKGANNPSPPPACALRRNWRITPTTRSSGSSAGAGWASSTWPTIP